jgi:hypothetical protein
MGILAGHQRSDSRLTMGGMKQYENEEIRSNSSHVRQYGIFQRKGTENELCQEDEDKLKDSEPETRPSKTSF